MKTLRERVEYRVVLKIEKMHSERKKLLTDEQIDKLIDIAIKEELSSPKP